MMMDRNGGGDLEYVEPSSQANIHIVSQLKKDNRVSNLHLRVPGESAPGKCYILMCIHGNLDS